MDNLREEAEVAQEEKWMTQISNQDVEKMLAAGQLAKLKLYQNLLRKIKDGESLKASELKTLHALEKEMECQNGIEDGPDVIQSYEEAAAYCGLSKRTISYHLKRGNLTQNPDGSFAREELNRFLQKYGRKNKSTGDAAAHRMKIEKADLRYRIARARREELLVAQLEGKLISIEEAECKFTERAYGFARSLLNLSRCIAHRVAAGSEKTVQEVTSIIDFESRKMLGDYCRPIEIEAETIAR